jgi:hypothetical protein
MTLQNGLPGQRGAALIVGLLVLVIMILLTLAMTNSTLMQTRMAGNFRDASSAFQASEAANRWAMAWLLSLDQSERPFPLPCTLRGLPPCTSADPVWEKVDYPLQLLDAEWLTMRSYGTNPSISDPDPVISAVSPARPFPAVSQQPRFAMEQVFFQRDDLAGPPQLGVAYYRVTSLGYGNISPATDKYTNQSVLSAVMGKRFE